MGVTMLTATFNIIQTISMTSVLLVREIGVFYKKTTNMPQNHWQTFCLHKLVSSTPHHCWESSHNISGDGHWFIKWNQKQYTTLSKQFQNIIEKS